MMYNQDMQLGGIHDHQTYMIHMNENIKPHRRSELWILNLLKKPKKMFFLQSVDVLYLFMKWVNVLMHPLQHLISYC